MPVIESISNAVSHWRCFSLVRPAWATTRWRKTTTRSAVGSVSRRQGYFIFLCSWVFKRGLFSTFITKGYAGYTCKHYPISERKMPNQRYVLRFDKSRCVWNLIRVEDTPLPEPPDPLLPVIDQVIGRDGWNGTATELLGRVQQIASDIQLMAIPRDSVSAPAAVICVPPEERSPA